MSERKPFAVPVESWVDAQISHAQRRGDFDDLPGAGKPLPPKPRSWLQAKLQEENLEVPLPPGLELRKEVRAKLAAIALMADEARVREALTLLNAKIKKQNATHIAGPPADLGKIDIERFVDDWRDKRAARPAR